MAVAIQAYYDGSGVPVKTMALAGYAATPDVWKVFEAEWWQVLADDSARPACRYLHMKEANALRGEFAADRGWTREGVDRLLADLHNRCFSPFGPHRHVAEALVGAACWIDLDAYASVCQAHPHFAEKKPEALCVDYVVGVALKRLVPGERIKWSELVARGQSVELFFDRNEPYLHQIKRIWEASPWHRRSRPLQLVTLIATVERESSAPQQAADFLAWLTNRDLSSQDGDLLARTRAFFSSHCFRREYNYDELLRTAEGWRPGRGYSAEPEDN